MKGRVVWSTTPWGRLKEKILQKAEDIARRSALGRAVVEVVEWKMRIRRLEKMVDFCEICGGALLVEPCSNLSADHVDVTRGGCSTNVPPKKRTRKGRKSATGRPIR